MIDIVVLLKLVPDIRHIPNDAWDTDRGTLRRNKLRLVPNMLDDRALALALRLRESWDGRITVISMGPPGTEELCSRALAFGADEALLICDPACAGSDTLATARTLAAAVKSFGAATHTNGPMLLIAGAQSPDGDTAQVPVQVASFLGMVVVPYVTAADVDPKWLELTSISQGGTSRTHVDQESLPVVMTCTDQLPSLAFHTSLINMDRAARTVIRRVTAADLGLELSEVGLAGSATRVVSIAGSPSARRAGALIRWPEHGTVSQEADRIVERIASVLSGDSGQPPASDSPDIARDGSGTVTTTVTNRVGVKEAVWVLVDENSIDLGLVSEARRIADAMQCAAIACTVAPSEKLPRKQLAAAGATEILAIEIESQTGAGAAAGSAIADSVTIAFAVEQTVRAYRPAVLLIPATPEGRVTAPYLAARLGAGLTADCTSFHVHDFTMRRDGKRVTYKHHLHQVRPALGGNILATIVSPANIDLGLPQIATVRPGVLPPAEWPEIDPRMHRFSVGKVELPGAGSLITEGANECAAANGAAEPSSVSIEACTVLVSVGRGAGGTHGIAEFARPLAEAIQSRFNVETEVSASRAVVDAGDIARERQVGQTGKTVRPDVYIALGISGSIQHRAGMDESGIIIGVNADGEAPIRQISDVFIHGRVEEVVPALTAALRRD